MNKFNELMKTINDNIDYLNYIITLDNKLVLVAECYEDGKHYVKIWNNIKSHDDVILERLNNNAKFMALWEKRCEKDN